MWGEPWEKCFGQKRVLKIQWHCGVALYCWLSWTAFVRGVSSRIHFAYETFPDSWDTPYRRVIRPPFFFSAKIEAGTCEIYYRHRPHLCTEFESRNSRGFSLVSESHRVKMLMSLFAHAYEMLAEITMLWKCLHFPRCPPTPRRTLLSTKKSHFSIYFPPLKCNHDPQRRNTFLTMVSHKCPSQARRKLVILKGESRLEKLYNRVKCQTGNCTNGQVSRAKRM